MNVISLQERLKWEKDNDPLIKMREWILENHIEVSAMLDRIEKEAEEEARQAQRKAWKNYTVCHPRGEREISGDRK